LLSAGLPLAAGTEWIGAAAGGEKELRRFTAG